MSCRHWTVEIAFPLKEVLYNTSGAYPRAGTFWRINFSRVEWRVLRVGNQFWKDPAYPNEDNWVWSPQASSPCLLSADDDPRTGVTDCVTQSSGSPGWECVFAGLGVHLNPPTPQQISGHDSVVTVQKARAGGVYLGVGEPLLF